MAKSNKTKSKKPFLKLGLILLAVVLFVGIGFALTGGSFLFAKNALLWSATGLGGYGVGYGLFKGASALFGRGKSSEDRQLTRGRERTRDRSQELSRDLEETLEDVPVIEEDEEIVVEQNKGKSKKETSNRTVGRK